MMIGFGSFALPRLPQTFSFPFFPIIFYNSLFITSIAENLFLLKHIWRDL